MTKVETMIEHIRRVASKMGDGKSLVVYMKSQLSDDLDFNNSDDNIKIIDILHENTKSVLILSKKMQQDIHIEEGPIPNEPFKHFQYSFHIDNMDDKHIPIPNIIAYE